MGSKLAETQEVEASLVRSRSRANFSSLPERLLNVLKRRATIRTIAFAGDALALVVAHRTAHALVERFLQVPETALNPPSYTLFYLPFLLAVLFVFEGNQKTDLRRPEKELELSVKGVSFAFLLLVCGNFVVFRSGFSRYLMVSWYLLTLLALLLVRCGLRASYGVLWGKGIATRKTVLIGSATKLFELQTLFTIQRHRGYELLGTVLVGDDSAVLLEKGMLPVLSSTDSWHEVAREMGAEQVIVALDEGTTESYGLVSDILNRCLRDGLEVQVYSDLFGSCQFTYEFDGFSGLIRFLAIPPWSKQLQHTAKTALDLAAGLIGGLLTVLFLPIVGAAIKLEDGGPIFYRREFVDCDGSIRYYLKYRTMCVDAQEILDQDATLKAKFREKHKLADDPRVTRVGRVLRKYSIDEFPQFFSLLRGRLTLVGPRTISREEAERYGNELPKLLSVKPGITGFWQVMGRQMTTYKERIQMDMFYIDRWSIWLDLWIAARTILKVVKAEGAY